MAHKKLNIGEVPGVKVGQIFPKRKDLYEARVHLQSMAGIDGKAETGAVSIVLSGGYEDDVDNGDEIVYTGCGGFEMNTGVQYKDQEFTGRNMALVTSCKERIPVRVIRGSQLRSLYAPDDGYRYDGLYLLEDYWSEEGKSGFLLCRYRLRRMEGQDPLPPPKDMSKVSKPKPRKRPAVSAPGDEPRRRLNINKPKEFRDNLHVPFSQSFNEVSAKLCSGECVFCGRNVGSGCEYVVKHLENHRNELLNALSEDEKEILMLRSFINTIRIRSVVESLENTIPSESPPPSPSVFTWPSYGNLASLQKT
jgi:hypothetical protein